MDTLRFSRTAQQILERGIRAFELTGRELKRQNDREERGKVTVDADALTTVVEFVRDDPALDHAPERSPVPPALSQLRDTLDKEGRQ